MLTRRDTLAGLTISGAAALTCSTARAATAGNRDGSCRRSPARVVGEAWHRFFWAHTPDPRMPLCGYDPARWRFSYADGRCPSCNDPIWTLTVRHLSPRGETKRIFGAWDDLPKATIMTASGAPTETYYVHPRMPREMLTRLWPVICGA